MAESSSTDLKIVLILTFLSVIFLFIPSLNQYPQNMVSYALLLLLLPGYSLLATIKPSVNEIVFWKRILFSIILGVILVVTLYVLWMYTPLLTYLSPVIKYLNPLEAYISPLETYMPLVFILSTLLIVDLVFISWARRKAPVSDLTPEIQEKTPKAGGKKERYVLCENCNGYYKLEEDESPEDFESCHCGGKLVYTEKLEGEPFTLGQETRPIQKGSYYLDLLLVFLVTIISLMILEFVNQPDYNTIIEFLLILFLPGYALISIIYPRNYDLNTLERLIYSSASSIVITTLVGLVLNYSSYDGINPILYSLSGLTVVFLIAAYLGRNSIPEVNRFSVDLTGFFNGLGKGFSRETRTEKLLSLVLVISLVLVVSTTYITANPLEETYTDFYVFGADGNPVNSINLTSNETDKLTISIVNHENKNTTYRALVTSSGIVLLDQTVTLKNEERKDIPFNFTVGEPGTRDMEFNLYKLPDNDKVYKSIKIPLNVAVNPALIVEEVPII